MTRKKNDKKCNTESYLYSESSTDSRNNGSVKKKWYQKTGWIILWLILFFPVGLFLMWKYSNWKKAVKIVISAFFALCVIGYSNTPDLESITLSADTTTVHDINEQIKIKPKVSPDSYSVSVNDFKTTGGEIKSKDGTIYFVSAKSGTFKVYAKSSGITSNTLTFKIEDKTAIAEAKKQEKEAKKKAAEEAKKQEEEAKKKAAEEAKKQEEEAKKKAAEEAKKQEEEAAKAAEQERIAAEQAAQQAEQERIAAEQAAQQQVIVQDQPQEQTVWLSATGSKYHSIPNCGNMNPNTARQVPLSQAQASGCEPCKKCW